MCGKFVHKNTKYGAKTFPIFAKFRDKMKFPAEKWHNFFG